MVRDDDNFDEQDQAEDDDRVAFDTDYPKKKAKKKKVKKAKKSLAAKKGKLTLNLRISDLKTVVRQFKSLDRRVVSLERKLEKIQDRLKTRR